jgi:hypothetical protein
LKNIALEEYKKDGDSEAFLLALRTVTEAYGGIGELAKKQTSTGSICIGRFPNTEIPG